MPDFSLLQTPNFAQAALSGYQAGSALGKQKQLDAAMSQIDLERPETLLPVLRADPSTGAALIGASTKLAAEKRDMASRQATAQYIKLLTGGGGVSGGGGGSLVATQDQRDEQSRLEAAYPNAPQASDYNGTAAATPNAAPGSDQADIVVTANRPAAPDPMVAARNAAIDADPTGFLDIQKQIGQMDDAQRKRVADATGAFSAVGNALLEIPYPQRKAYIMAHAADLAAHGVPPEKINSFDPTDQNIHYEVGQAIGIKGQLEQQDKNRSFGLQQQQFGETQKQHGIENGLSASRLGIEGARLGLARNADARAASSASGAGKPTAGAPTVAHYEYRVVNGVTQRRLIK